MIRPDYKFRKVCLLFLVFVAYLTTPEAGQAGVWHSSGGEVFGSDKNPWFVIGEAGGVREVKYCVQHDGNAMSISRERAQALITESLQYWKTELAWPSGSIPTNAFRVATQTFREVEDCQEGGVALIFKLGYTLLDQAEREKLIEPRRFIGVTIRKEYDLVKLTGSGVIIIGSDKGVDDQTYIRGESLIAEAWKSERLFQYAIMHELGHVFGIPHGGSGLMAETFLEQVLHKQLSAFYEKTPLISFRRGPVEFQLCHESGSFHRPFFGVNSTVSCLKFRRPPVHPEESWQVIAVSANAETKIGDLSRGQILQRTQTRPTCILHFVGSQQEVFSPAQSALYKFLMGPLSEEVSMSGTFIPNSGPPKAVYIDMKPESITLVGQNVDGQALKPVLSYSVPSILRAQ